MKLGSSLSGLVTSLALLNLGFATSCKTTDSAGEDAGVSAVELQGESGSGKSDITLEVYPLKNGKIQMERTVVLKETHKITEQKYTCDTKENLVSKGIDKDTIAKLYTPKVDKINDESEFKQMQQAMMDSPACDKSAGFYPPEEAISKKTNPQRQAMGEIATEYKLYDNGRFSRIVDGHECDITTGVEDFKLSAHPTDVAFAYFIKAGNLWIVRKSDDNGRNCPRVDSKMLFADVAKEGRKYQYWVVPTTHTTLVNMATDTHGRFVAWDARSLGLDSRDANAGRVVDTTMNQCFGVDGKSFNSYVTFLYTDAKKVVKIKGDTMNEFKTDSTNYAGVNDFITREKVCAVQR